jgi:hypothetical protein
MRGTIIVALEVKYVYPDNLTAEQAEDIVRSMVITGHHLFSKVEGVSVNEVNFCEYGEK